MLIYLDNDQAKTLTDILEGTIRRDEMTDWADYQHDSFGLMVRVERPDLVAVSKSRVKLCSDLIDNLKSMVE